MMIRSTHSLRHHKRQQHVLELRRLYQSETLQWASQHRVLAQRCLNVPTTSAPSGPPAQPIRSWEAYLEWRQWKFPLELPGEDTDKAVALVSHVLSAPLTAATQLFSTFLDNQSHFSGTMNWCCVGARAEASLPVEYWKEILVLWAHASPSNACNTATTTTTTNNKNTSNKLNVTIDFVGPDVLRRPSTHLTYEGHSLTLRWMGPSRIFATDAKRSI